MNDNRRFVECRLSFYWGSNVLDDDVVERMWAPLAVQAAREYISRLQELAFGLSEWRREAAMDEARISELLPSFIAEKTQGELPPDPFEDLIETIHDVLAEFVRFNRPFVSAGEHWVPLHVATSAVATGLSSVIRDVDDLLDSRLQIQLQRATAKLDRGDVEAESRTQLQEMTQSVKDVVRAIGHEMNKLKAVSDGLLDEMRSSPHGTDNSDVDQEPSA